MVGGEEFQSREAHPHPQPLSLKGRGELLPLPRGETPHPLRFGGQVAGVRGGIGVSNYSSKLDASALGRSKIAGRSLSPKSTKAARTIPFFSANEPLM